MKPIDYNVTNIGTYHLADNPDLYDVQRINNFEFIVTDIDNILRAGVLGTEENARIPNAQEILRLSVATAFVPNFTIEPIVLKRGNNSVKYAGTPTFKDGSIKLNEFVGADSTSVLMAWQSLAYNVRTEKVGSLDVSNYKKLCYLQEFTPDYRLIRRWILKGCWCSGIDSVDFDNENTAKKTITATIQYDTAMIDWSELE